ncbi:hypothetical protein KM481_gp14 [Harp seal herpesvirus]|uniref:Protein UL79 n=1 Tax=phocid gammaherpesvirus 3 TaxID=2560643 RepID=A0A0R5Z2L3_9GAMA|nr:hypothetical protein KM481_gp14 [Harp seal herpesvirus]AJG42944.1 hypothetical protein [Harp seal herpesvirus]
MGILGKYVSAGKPMSFGVEELMWKMVKNKSLNSLENLELRYLHLILCKMYNFSLNCLLFRDALANCGCRDDTVLSRKVPVEFWRLMYDGCLQMGVINHMLQSEQSRAALWLHFNSHPRLLEGLTNYITQRLGLNHHVEIFPHNITDGNYIYSLGSVLPARLLMTIAFCLVNWGRQESEYWVRTFSKKIFVLYLILSGFLNLSESFLLTGYEGPVDVVIRDLQATAGIVARGSPPTEDAKQQSFLKYLFIFNNNMLIDLDYGHCDGQTT